MQEARFGMLARTDPEHAKHLFALAQADIDDTWNYYSQMADVERKITNTIDEVES
jgi:pyruvate-ferredoxin/flavodoxin oxidoreductase